MGFVQQILDLKLKFDRIIANAFKDEQKCHKELKESFESFMNKDQKSAYYLCSYIDDYLKNGHKVTDDNEADEQLNKVLVIFKYLQDKDVFENIYKGMCYDSITLCHYVCANRTPRLLLPLHRYT